MTSRAELLQDLHGITVRHGAAQGYLKTHRARMAVIEAEKIRYTKAGAILDTVIQKVAANGVDRVQRVVTQGLQLVFGPEVSLVLERVEGARGTQYRLKIKDGEVVGTPMDSFGGGVVNVTSFLLRVLMLHRFRMAKLLVLDESFNNISLSHQAKVSEMLRSLCDDHGYSILAVTHQPELAVHATRTYSVGGEKGNPVLHLLGVGEVA